MPLPHIVTTGAWAVAILGLIAPACITCDDAGRG